MDAGGVSFTLITIVGVVLLGALIAWAALRNRTSRADESEAATRKLYEDEEREHHGESDRVP